MTLSQFGNDMRSYFTKSNMPFIGRTKDTVGTLYVAR
jgi:hypothetical protein